MAMIPAIIIILIFIANKMPSAFKPPKPPVNKAIKENVYVFRRKKKEAKKKKQIYQICESR